MDTIYNVGSRLKEALELRQMTQAELSRKSGVDRSAVCRYVKGNVKPKSKPLVAMADALAVTPAWLLGIDNTEPPKAYYASDLEDAGIDLKVLTKANRNKLIGYYHGLVDSQIEG